VVALSDALGADVRDSAGAVVGRVAELVASVDEDCPVVVALEVRAGRRPSVRVPWSDVASFEESGVTLRSPLPAEPAPPPGPGELALGRDVLDTQIVDLAGRRLARVADVDLDRDDGRLRVTAVETGLASVVRRLGLGRLAGRGRRKTVDWTRLHFVTGRAPELMLEARPDRVAGLDAAELAHVLARMPPEQGAALLRSAPTDTAARAIGLGRPRLGAEVVTRVEPAAAAGLVDRMPEDDAVAVLRHVPAVNLEPLLRELPSARAAELRRLLAFPPATAAGLMTTDVRTVGRDDDPEAVRAALLERPPRLEGLQTVFVAGPDGRPEGVLSPLGLLAGRVTAIPVPLVREDASLEEIADRFALEDVLALPVVDADGRLVGAVAADDVLEELLAERLPGPARFRRHRILRRSRAQEPLSK
jgi:sporulation protein YlmC with PRC-barrel domain